MKKIIIVGLGNMGVAHLNSFINNKIQAELYLVEKRISRHENIKKILLKKKVKNFYLLKKSPKNKLFHFAIIATKPKDRLKAIKKLTNNNKIRFLFLEKFLFNELIQYKKFNKINRKKVIKTFVNIWSNLFLNSVGIKRNKKKFLIKVFLPENKMLTNLIHFYEIFRILAGRKFKIDFSNFTLEKKRDYYDGIGKIKLRNKKGSEMTIESKRIKDTFIFLYKSKKVEKNLQFLKGKMVYLNKKNRKKINFPLASITTCRLYKSLIFKDKSRKNIRFPKYSVIERNSKTILRSLFSHYKKKIRIN